MLKSFRISIFSLILMTFFSCRKEAITIDREDALSNDTAFFIYEVKYNSHTTTALNFTVDVLRLNGSHSESSYSGLSFVDTSYFPEQSISFSSAQSYTHPVNSSYSTILLFDYAETEFYKQEYVEYYLRRFFEIADSLPNRNVALSSMSAEQNTVTRLHTEHPGDIFDNSWKYNVEQFYNLTVGEDNGANPTSGLFLKGRLLGLMDSLVASSQATGDLSITLITGYASYDFSYNPDLHEIVDYAKAKNIRINIISPGNNPYVAYIATETGGFNSCRNRDAYNNELPYEQQFSNIQVTLQNLDDLLMNNVVTHRVNATVAYTAGSTWNTGDHVNLVIRYSNYSFDIGVKIP